MKERVEKKHLHPWKKYNLTAHNIESCAWFYTDFVSVCPAEAGNNVMFITCQNDLNKRN